MNNPSAHIASGRIVDKMEKMAENIDRAILSGEPFAMAMLPRETTPIWFANGMAETRDTSFEVIPWLGKFDDRAIFSTHSSTRLDSIQASGSIPTRSTPLQEYLRNVAHTKESCRERGGKTVISRIITGKLPQKDFSIGQLASRYFELNPHTFRYIFHVPNYGGWIASTPELLVDFDTHEEALSTMAFAGTRPKGTPDPWDAKNIQENRFVADYIIDALRGIGLNPTESTPRTVAFGPIEHLCIDITANAPGSALRHVMDALNPTPALCGTPLEDAIADISRYESHQRCCYGGVVAVATPGRYRAFVNLRCLQFAGDRFCIYGGGGITSASSPAREFEETEAKTSMLQNLIIPTPSNIGLN